MTNKSISYKLSIYISLAVIGVFIIFIIVHYFFSQQLLKEKAEYKAVELSTQVNSRVNRYVRFTQEITGNISDQAVYYAENDDTEQLIALIMKKYHFLNAIHINFDSAVQVSHHNYFMIRVSDSLHFEYSNTKIYDCENEKEIFSELIQAKKSGWSEPYRCGKPGNVVAAFYYPVQQVNNAGDTIHQGEIICELSLLYLNKYINEIELENDGFAFLVDNSGKFITHPKPEWILNQSIFGLSDNVFKISRTDFSQIVSRKLSGSTIAFPELLDYEKSWVYYTPVNAADWYLIFVLPYNELFSDLYLTTVRLLFFAVLGIIAIYLIVTYISNKLIEPLSNVTTQLNRFSSKTGTHPLNTFNEIQQVSNSLKSLKAWYAKQKAEQSQALIQNNLQKQDLMQASEIQQSIIKTEFPAFPDRPEVDVYAIYKPAREVSGDLFDFFFTDDENLVFTIGDVSGKGVPAAIFMSISQTIIKSNAFYKKAKNIVNKANKELCTNNQHQFFLTLFLGVLKIRKKELYYCNAAHTSGIILKPDGEMIELKESHGLPLGLYPEKEYADSKINLEKNDTIILYTDGVTELQNKDKLQFGLKRLKNLLITLTGLEPFDMAQKIEKELNSFQGKAEQYDDLSLLIVKFKA
ncbi:MAG: SpoIIE family protein phosphatase [Bacteroidota bacterium]